MTVNIPCKIGDDVWTIRDFKGHKRAALGKVSEMYFVSESMKLVIVVYHISRGVWGKNIFATEKEAENAIKEAEK